MPLYRELDGVDRRGVRVLMLVAAGAVLLVLSCCLLLPSLTFVAVWQPVWLDDGWIYHLREHDLDGKELWRQRQDGGAERVRAAVPGTCDGGTLEFLFRMSGDRLGVGIECGGGTELMSYHTVSDGFVKIGGVGTFAVNGAVIRRGASRALELPSACGIDIGLLGPDGRMRLLLPTRPDGRTWELAEPTGEDCRRRIIASNPASSWDGRRLYFLAAPATLGALPLTTEALHSLSMDLHVWGGDAKTALRSIASLPGRGGLAVAPDGSRVAAASGGFDGPGMLLVDPDSGESRVIAEGSDLYDPAFSPDGKRLAYVKDLEEIEVVPLDRNV